MNDIGHFCSKKQNYDKVAQKRLQLYNILTKSVDFFLKNGMI